MAPPPLDDSRLLAFARRLQALDTFDALVEELCREVREAIGYSTAWLAILDEDGRSARFLSIQGPMADQVWETAPLVPIDGDPYMERIRDERTVQIIEDAQIAEDVNREIVRALGNRTIVNVPLTLIDRAFGCIGTGTFGDEGVRLPSDEELRYLDAMGQQLVMASARLLLDKQREEAAAEREALERRLRERHRLESMGRMAAEVAHEFNNLLQVMIAKAQLVRVREEEPAKAMELDAIVEAGVAASKLSRKLLALGKQQPLELQQVDLRDCLEEAAEVARSLYPQDVRLRYEPPRAELRARVDRTLIRRLLINLLLNARDASLPAGGPITLGATVTDVDEAIAAELPSLRQDPSRS